MKTFVEKIVAVRDFTELDLDFPHHETDEYGEDIRNDVMIPHSKLDYVEVPSMDINDVIQTLNDFKKMGANRVYIADHIDHHGYYFYGVKLIEI